MFYFINHNLQNPFFDAAMPFITHLGGFISLLAICILAVILSIVFKKQNAKRFALLCLLSLLISGIIAFILKNMFTEPRPFVLLDNVRLLITENDPNSFPSGHTASTFTVLSVLMFKYRNRILTTVLLLCGFLVGFSRIYVGVHFPLDVFAGFLVGIIPAYLVCRYEGRIMDMYDGLVGVIKKN